MIKTDHLGANINRLAVLRFATEGIFLDELLDVYDLYLLFQAALWHHVFGKALIHVIEHALELPIEIRITR